MDLFSVNLSDPLSAGIVAGVIAAGITQAAKKPLDLTPAGAFGIFLALAVCSAAGIAFRERLGVAFDFLAIATVAVLVGTGSYRMVLAQLKERGVYRAAK